MSVSKHRNKNQTQITTTFFQAKPPKDVRARTPNRKIIIKFKMTDLQRQIVKEINCKSLRNNFSPNSHRLQSREAESPRQEKTDFECSLISQQYVRMNSCGVSPSRRNRGLSVSSGNWNQKKRRTFCESQQQSRSPKNSSQLAKINPQKQDSPKSKQKRNRISAEFDQCTSFQVSSQQNFFPKLDPLIKNQKLVKQKTSREFTDSVLSPTHFASRDTFLSERSKDETVKQEAKQKLQKSFGISNQIRDYQQKLQGWETKVCGYKNTTPKSIKHYIDASELESQIKELKTVLQRLEPGQNDYVVSSKEAKSILLIKNSSVTLTIPCADQPSPCIIRVNYLGNQNQLEAYVSVTQPKPNKSNCDFFAYSPNVIKVVAGKDLRTFFSKQIYVTLQSQDTKTVQLSASFGMNKRVTQGSTSFQKEDSEFVKRYREEWIKLTSVNKTPKRQNSPRSRVIVDKDWEQRHSEAVQRRQIEQDQNHRKHEFLRVKWEFVRRKRIELLEKYQIVFDRKIISEFWVRAILQHLKVKIFNENVRLLILNKIQIMKMKFAVYWIQIRFKTLQKRLRKTLPQRIQQYLKYTIQFGALFIKGLPGESAQAKLFNFLEREDLNYQVTNKLDQTMKDIEFLQNSYRSHRNCIRQRQQFVSELWQEQVGIITHYFIKSQDTKAGKTKFSSDAILKVNFIEPNIKHRVLQLYLIRQNFLHSIRFMQWCIMFKEGQYTGKHLVESQEKIQTRLTQLYEIDKILFLKLELPQFEIGVQKKDAEWQKLQEKVTAKHGWNSLERLQLLMFPIKFVTKEVNQSLELKVPGTKFSYKIHIGPQLPLFTYLPTSIEIFQRLILKAAFTPELSKFKLAKSQC